MSLMQTPFLKRLADEVSPLQDRVIFHPLFSELYEGKLSLEQLRGYTVQACLWKTYVNDLLPVAMEKSPPDVRELTAKNLAMEVGGGGQPSHTELLMRFGEEIGLSREAFRRASPILEVGTFCSFLARVFYEEDFLGPAAVSNYALEGLLVKKYPRIIRALREHYRVSPRGLEFWEIHLEADAEHSSDGEKILARYATTQDQQARAISLAKLALQYRFGAVNGCYHRYAPSSQMSAA